MTNQILIHTVSPTLRNPQLVKSQALANAYYSMPAGVRWHLNDLSQQRLVCRNPS